ncbi:MAG: thioredoxin family protein [Clostridiaceae bacterium]|nr:thioredoxin family protein [Clostridiaceae bacterium]
MKKITMFMFDECPHCQLALRLLDELMAQDEYKDIEITKINERKNPEIADQYDYYYVPTFYVENEKVHEGHAEREDVKKVLDLAKA